MNDKRKALAKRQWFRFLNDVSGVANREPGTKVIRTGAETRNSIRRVMKNISDGVLSSRRETYHHIFGAYLMDDELQIMPGQILVSRARHDSEIETKIEMRYQSQLITSAQRTTLANICARMCEVGLFDAKFDGENEIVIVFSLPTSAIPLYNKSEQMKIVTDMSEEELNAALIKIKAEISSRKQSKAEELVKIYVEKRKELIEFNKETTRVLKEMGVFDEYKSKLNDHSL